MNKRFLLTTFTIIAVMVSNNLILANPNHTTTPSNTTNRFEYLDQNTQAIKEISAKINTLKKQLKDTIYLYNTCLLENNYAQADIHDSETRGIEEEHRKLSFTLEKLLTIGRYEKNSEAERISKMVRDNRFDSSPRKNTEDLLDKALHLKIQAYKEQYEADTKSEPQYANFFKATADMALRAANEAEKDLIEFGNTTYAAEMIDGSYDPTNTQSTEIFLTSLKAKIIETAKNNIKHINNKLQEQRYFAVLHSLQAIRYYEEYDKELLANKPDDAAKAWRPAAHRKFAANIALNEVTESEAELALYETILKKTEQEFNNKINAVQALENTQPSFKLTFTQYPKAIFINKWTKRAAGAIVACATGKWLYNRYTQSNRSNDAGNE